MGPRGRGLVAVVGAFAALLAAAVVVQAQATAAVTIERAELDEDGSSQVIVSVDGFGTDLPSSAFAVTEDGQAVDGIEVTAVEDAEQVDVRTVVLLLDASGSTEGEPIDAAREAAIGFAESVMEVGVQVGVATFSDEAQLVQPPTDDVTAVVDAIADVEAAGETALYDAVLVGARTLQNLDGSGSMVVFSDGGDTVSEATLEAAQTAAQTADAPVSTVALDTGDLDLDSLQQLAGETGGDLLQVGNADELAGAFEQVATSLTNQYVLTYTSGVATGELELGVSVALDGVEATDTITLLTPRDDRAVGEPRAVEVGDPGIFADPVLLYVALGALFLAILIVLAYVLVPSGDQRVARTLERGLRVYRRAEGTARPAAAGSGTIGRRAVDLVSAVPRPAGYDDRVQAQLDRAAWPLRATEFTTLRALAVVVGVLVGWGLFGSLLLGVVGAVVGWFLPRLLLEQRVSARQAKFLAQLPDTLQLLAGALKAGYGILQGIDTVVKETDDPTSSEFRQVLTEARLGLPLEDSLDAMAERIDADDFRWVTVAINIQRRVGGNLAELLETVAETLREREMVRRQITTLSAEGRLSGIILMALPIVLSLYMIVVNPSYIGTLFTETVGQVMVGGAVLLMIVGGFWMRRLIDIDV